MQAEMQAEMTSKSLASLVRAGYAWPGGYEIAFIMSDGEMLCMDCAKKEFRGLLRALRDPADAHSGWRVAGFITSDWMEGEEICCHCNGPINKQED